MDSIILDYQSSNAQPGFYPSEDPNDGGVGKCIANLSVGKNQAPWPILYPGSCTLHPVREGQSRNIEEGQALTNGSDGDWEPSLGCKVAASFLTHVFHAQVH